MRRGGGKKKGDGFEIKQSKVFSQWWSKNGDDDLFWHTHGSGARATARSKRAKKTRGQYGDMAATDSRGRTLTKLLTFSFKCGYPKVSFAHLVERVENATATAPEIAEWLQKCVDDAHDAGSPGWILVMKHTRRDTILLMPLSFVWRLRGVGCKIEKANPNFTILAHLGPSLSKKKEAKLVKKGKLLRWFLRNEVAVFGTTLENFLKYAKRKHFVKIKKQWKKEKKHERRLSS